MNKFNQGNKVVPSRKSVSTELHESIHWRRAQEKGQPYLYLRRYVDDLGDKVVSCVSGKDDSGGDFFLESDLTLYEEKPAPVVVFTLEEDQASVFILPATMKS